MSAKEGVQTQGIPLSCIALRRVILDIHGHGSDCFQHIVGPADIMVLTLDRPAAKNALSASMLSQFSAALDQLRFDQSVRAVIIRSNVAKVFCAGADLKERATMTKPQVAAFVHSIRSTFNSLAALPMPTIAAIEGAALGGGLEMALACDFRIAGEDALLGLSETSLAIIPGAGGTQRLPRLIGVPKAKELIFTAARLPASRANDYGLLTSLVPAGSALERSIALARTISENGPVAVRMSKQAIDAGMQTDIATGMAIEAACYAQIIPTTDRLEGLQAFKEKRKPVYKGE